MTEITIPDPYVDLYRFEAMSGTPINFKWQRKDDVEFADHILSKVGSRDVVISEKDWLVVEELVNLFERRWPDEWKQFKSTIPDIRESRKARGYSTSREIKFVGAMPIRLNKLIKAVFPYQQFDKRFVNRLVKRIKLLKIGGEGN